MANIFRFTVAGTGPLGDLWEFGTHWQTDLAIGGDELGASEILPKLQNHFGSTSTNLSKIANVLGTDCSITKLYVYERVAFWAGETGTSAELDVAITGTLGTSADRPPQAMCTWVALHTALAGRSFRGGFHSPPVANVSVLSTDGRLEASSAYMTNMGVLKDAAIADIGSYDAEGSDVHAVVYSETRHRRGESHTENITSGVVKTDPRWLRRRMTGHGV